MTTTTTKTTTTMTKRMEAKPAAVPMTNENKQRVLEALNIPAEYRNLGLDVTGKPSADGWISCRVMWRKDQTASAGVNVNPSHRHFGYYHDHGAVDGEEHLSFWDFCVKTKFRF